jgi:hypothetical protein
MNDYQRTIYASIAINYHHVLASSNWLKGNTLYTIKWLQLTPAG